MWIAVVLLASTFDVSVKAGYRDWIDGLPSKGMTSEERPIGRAVEIEVARRLFTRTDWSLDATGTAGWAGGRQSEGNRAVGVQERFVDAGLRLRTGFDVRVVPADLSVWANGGFGARDATTWTRDGNERVLRTWHAPTAFLRFGSGLEGKKLRAFVELEQTWGPFDRQSSFHAGIGARWSGTRREPPPVPETPRRVRPITVHAKRGWHEYRGTGWSMIRHNFDDLRKEMSGPVTELGVGSDALTVKHPRLGALVIDFSAVAMSGWHRSGGNGIRLATTYADSGGRATLRISDSMFGAGAYVQAGAGIHHAEFWWDRGELHDVSGSALGLSRHLATGTWFAVGRARVGLEMKQSVARVRFPDASADLDVGGVEYFLTGACEL